MINFLQAAYKITEIPQHSCYDIGKDYIIPFFSTIVAFGGAVYIMKKQILKQKKIEEERISNENLLTKKIYRLNVKKLIEDLEQIKPIIENEFRELKNQKVRFLPSLSDFNSPTLKLLANLNYQVQFKAFLATKDDVESFNSSFRTILRIDNQIQRINAAVSNYIATYHEVMDFCIQTNADLFRLNSLFFKNEISYAKEVLSVITKYIKPKQLENSIDDGNNVSNLENFGLLYKDLRKIELLYLDDGIGYEFYQKCNRALTKVESLDKLYNELESAYDSLMKEFGSYITNLSGIFLQDKLTK